MRIESRKAQTDVQRAVGWRTPRKRCDAQGIPGQLTAQLLGPSLRLSANVHAGASQEPRSLTISFGETETAMLRAVLLHNLGPTDSAELKALRELRDDVRAFISDAQHGLGPDLIRLIRTVERLP